MTMYILTIFALMLVFFLNENRDDYLGLKTFLLEGEQKLILEIAP
jgi:hypothetical protein